MSEIIQLNTITQEEFEKITLAKLNLGKDKDVSKAITTLKSIKEITNKETYEIVHENYMILKNRRIKIEKLAKELRDPQTALNKKLSELEKKMIRDTLSLENEYGSLKKQWEAQEEEKKRNQEQEELNRLNNRIRLLALYNASLPIQDIKTMPEIEFDALIRDLRQEHGDREEVLYVSPPVNTISSFGNNQIGSLPKPIVSTMNPLISQMIHNLNLACSTVSSDPTISLAVQPVKLKIQAIIVELQNLEIK